MNVEMARMVLAVITGIGAGIWLLAFRFLLAAGAKPKPGQQAEEAPAEEHAARISRWPENWVSGSVEVAGQPALLADQAVSFLARGDMQVLGPIKIVEKTDDRIVFERPGPSTHPAGGWFRTGELHFTPLQPGRTRIDWGCGPFHLGWMLKAAWAIQCCGLIALIAGCLAIYHFVISSPDPAVRWQTVQMVQVIHFLWPPFLFGGLYRKVMQETAARLDTLASNLPYQAG